MASAAIFQPALFEFFRELEENNDREWFAAHKERYEEDVKDPALRFISEVGPGLREISPYIEAIPKAVGGSLFRIYRDVRFSKDKRPYKTNLAMQFRHVHGKDVHAPGFYLHIAPETVFMGTGIYRPASPVLRRVREAMMEDPDAWRQAKAELRDPLEFGGESLKTSPRGVPADHPLIEDLRRKDLFVAESLEPEDVLAPDFAKRFVESCRGCSPLTAYLCRALDAPF
ncbi:MAG: DUF2461 domain-containing protein [Acidobacteriota bacterium]